jgi:hypothetical protein
VIFEHVNLVRVQDGTTSRNVTLVIAEGRVSPADRLLGTRAESMQAVRM